MKKLILAASVALLTACATPQQEQIDFMPNSVLSNSDIVSGKSYNLTSRDSRSAQYVALLDNGRSNIEPIHARQNLRVTIEKVMAEQFASQGFRNAVQSDNVIDIDIQEALVNVTQSTMSHEMVAHVSLALTLETPTGKMVKTYTGSAQKKNSFGASRQDIQDVLNDVTDNVLIEISKDQELQNYMKERF
ncbi:YajG family lipoprotein [Vibrio sp. WXL103]|uniref:YajG family lipoprotein n=1 Tax=Vibrio sp. WXL103 TaxID=3450710 RepID=UPI003EC5E960